MNNPEILDYIKKSFELKNQGFYKPAIEMLYKALALDCENIEILAQLAHIYKILGNLPRAINYIEKVLEINPKHIDCMLLLEEIYLEQKNIAAAESVSEKIYEIQPTPQNLAKQINILNKLKNFAKIKNIEALNIELNDEVLYELAYFYYYNHSTDKAIEFLELGHAKNNENQNIMFLLGKIYYELNNFEKSKQIFIELEKINSNAEVENYLGLFCLNDNNFSEAIEHFLTALNSEGKNAEYSYNLASAYFLNGWLDEALKYFNMAICSAPDNVNYHYSLAYLYYQKKLYDKALKELEFIQKVMPQHTLAAVLNAMITAQKGDLLTAENTLKNIIKDNNTDDFANYALAQIYKELSQLDSAAESINRAIELNPNSLEYLSEFSQIQILQKKYKEALKLIKQIIQINDKYVFAYISAAKIYAETKELDKLYYTAQEIIELDSNSPEGYYYNAMALFEQGDKDFAIENLKKSISLDLSNAMLYAKMSEFYQDTGDFKSAYEWAKEASVIDERNYKYKWLCAKLAVILHNEDEAIKNYSKSYRLASFDKDLCKDYSDYLKSIGKEQQAEKILKI